MPNLRLVPESPPRTWLLMGPCTELPLKSSSPEDHSIPRSCQWQACAEVGKRLGPFPIKHFCGGGGEPGERTPCSLDHSLVSSVPLSHCHTACRPLDPRTHDTQGVKIGLNWGPRTPFRRENKAPHRKQTVHTMAMTHETGSALLFKEMHINTAVRSLFCPTYWQQLKEW